jgi:hypothetical protein
MVNLREMMGLRLPIIAAVIGEGGTAQETLQKVPRTGNFAEGKATSTAARS